MIETGRHHSPKIDRNNLRFCQICLKCNVFSIEDEFHFFFVCPAYATVRELYFKPEWNNTVITVQKFHNIMSSKAKQDISSIAKFLLSTFTLRKFTS